MKWRGSLHDYFERALRHPPAALPREVLWCRDEDGCIVAFRIRKECDRVVEVEYRSTTCATLLAVCEHLTDLIPGMTVTEALAYSSANLVALHPEIPAGRRARADLAVRALHASLA
jgi:NifU-like protein involved in Fe-S cluster formation